MTAHAAKKITSPPKTNEKTSSMVQYLSDLPLVLKPRHIQEVLDTSKTNTYELLHSGEIASVRIGRTFRIPRAALAKYLGIDDERLAPLPAKKGGDAT